MSSYSAITSPGEASYSHLAAGALLLSFDVLVCSLELSPPVWRAQFTTSFMHPAFPLSHSALVPTKINGMATVRARGEFDITRNNKSQAYQVCPDIQGHGAARTKEIPCSFFPSLCLSLRISILLPETCRGHSWIVQHAVSPSLGRETIAAEVLTRKPAGHQVPSAHRPLPQTPLRNGLQPFHCLLLPLRPRCLPWDVFLSFNVVKPNVLQVGKSQSMHRRV